MKHTFQTRRTFLGELRWLAVLPLLKAAPAKKFADALVQTSGKAYQVIPRYDKHICWGKLPNFDKLIPAWAPGQPLRTQRSVNVA